MKTYLRLLGFAKPLEKFAIPYIFATLLAVVFGTLNLTLLIPLFDTLLPSDPGKLKAVIEAPKSNLDFIGYIKYFVFESKLNNGASKTLTYVCLFIVGSVFLSNLFRYLSQRIMEDLRVHTLLNMRKKVFNNVMDLHLGYFNNERKGDIMSKVSSDVQVVQFTVTNTLQVVFKEPLTLIIYFIVLFTISAKLTLFSILVIPISGFFIARIVKNLKRQATIAQESFAKMISFLDEALGGIKIIKAFNYSEASKDKFQVENEFYSNMNRKMVRRQQLGSPVSEFLGVSMVAIIVWYGGNLIIGSEKDALTTSDFIAYIAIFSQIMRPAKAITDSFSGIHAGIAAGERVLDLIDTKPAMINKENAVKIENFNDKLVFQNVSFKYGDLDILKNISFTVKKGQTVALVGPSGGGKSTLLDLIPRFHDPLNGKLTFDGIDYEDIQMESLREQMGIVIQESILFNDTIFNNIAFGKPGATLEEVQNAAQIANAHEFIIASEDGYNTYVGDRGNKLSGGQKQRICIARAVLGNPPIMLLDEATSALDTNSEKLVQESLNNLMQNRTSIIIAHRLSTIQHADLILVIENGEIAEYGNHLELLNQNGLYKKLIDLQAFND